MAVETGRLGFGGSGSRTRKERPEPDAPRLRVLWLIVMAALLASAIWGRLAYWQVVEHGKLAGQALAEHSELVTLPASRGVLLDREMRPLAVNTTVYSVYVSPQLIDPRDRERVALGLGQSLSVPAEQVMATLVSGRKFAYIARRQSKDRADALRKLQLPGVGLQAEQQRSYLPGADPATTLAANLLGYVNYDGVGQYGVEAFYNQRLAGQDGLMSTYRDLANREISLGGARYQAPVNGSDLVLSIDSNIQYAAEQALANGVKAAKAESGSVIVMDPKTGGIVASADYPSYNGNQFTAADPARVKDPIVFDLYEPGSVMKVVTLAGALDAHAITPQTTFYDPGYTTVQGQVIKDWDLKNHGTVTMTNVLEHSLNVGAIKAEQLEGPDNFYRYLQAFGFGSPTGLDVAGERSAPMGPPAQWKPIDLATASFGQGIAVNMVQMCSALNVIANHGRYAPPHVVERIGGQPTNLAATQRQVISPEAADQMTQMMKSVVQNGSGWTARVPGFEKDQAGKTGTSQMAENGVYSFDHVWASYAGFLPADNPRYTMLVVVRKPNNGSFDHNEGYFVSAPIWKQIASAIDFQWRITPTGPVAPPRPSAQVSG